ncbi:helix-turn-helix transcriptional regulator [bacterium]|nr:helix-turn-helix transcriptional regulator [bacterium]
MANDSKKLIILGRNIQNARKNMKLSQNELAEKLSISREHLAKIETAKRGISIKLLFKISDVLSVSEKDLFNFE